MVRLYPLLTVVTLIVIMLFVSTGVTLATPPLRPDDVMWSQEIGGPGDEHGFSTITTADGGYAVAGMANLSGTEYGLLVKTDALGYENWNRTYSAGQLAELYDLGQAADGGFVLAGSMLPEAARHDFAFDGLVVKTDATGAQQWMKTFGGSSLDIFTAVMADGNGYAFAGLNSSGDSSSLMSCLVNTDLDGRVVFESRYGEDGKDLQCYDAKRTSDGGYILAGSSGLIGVYGRDQPYVAKIGDQGKVQWQKALAAGSDNYAESVAIADDGYVIAGTIDHGTANGSYDFYLTKLDQNGNILWSQSYGGLKEDRAKCVVVTPDGGYLVVGIQGPEDGNTSAYVVKTNSAGELEWDRSFEDSGKDIRLYRATVAPDGGYVLTGYVSTYGNGDDVWLVKLRGEPGYGSATTAPTPHDPGCCCAPLLVLPLLLIGTVYAAVRRR